jgi:fructokinase
MSEDISIGVDLGGTKIEAAVIRETPSASTPFTVLARRRVPTGADGGYEAVLANTVAVIRETAKEAAVDPLAVPVGLGLPGSVTRREGRIKNSNTRCLNGTPFRADVSRTLGREVLFENDANCFALAEARLGAAREYADGVVFGVIMGTGVGGGVVLKGRVWGGPQGLGGEWGHHAVGPWRRPSELGAGPARGVGISERPPCSCGKMGCLELYASGGGAEAEYFRRTGKRARLADLVALRATDPDAGVVFDELLEAFGRGLANVIDILDPSAVVLGGGVSNLPLLYTEGRARVQAYVFNDELITPILPHALGDSAGVIGAALLHREGLSGA